MLLWIILLLVAAIVCLLLAMKVGVRVSFGDALRVWVKAGPLLLQVYPMARKKKKKQEKKPKDAEPEKAPKPGRNITPSAVWTLLQALLEPTFDAMRCVRKGLRVHRLSLMCTVSDPDPAAAAKRYGALNAVLWPLVAAAEQLVTVERRDLRVRREFAAHRSHAEGEVFITIRIYHGVKILLRDGVPMLRALLQFLKDTTPAPQKEAREEHINRENAA